MKRKQLFPLLISAVLLALAACAALGSRSTGQPLRLYFTSTDDHGPALLGEAYAGAEAPTADELIAALLAGPSTEGLRSPFPSGLTLRGTTLKNGVLTVDFSEHYGGLTDVSLTLADYCVVLTVCQLDGVKQVEITVSGQSMPYRSHSFLTREEALLLTN